MDFARNQMTKHGWTDGQGLGKDEEGIKEAIKVKMKQDKKGVGHDPGEEFSFHWWDHVFNKAASKIQVNSTEDGVEIKNTGDTKVSKKKDSKTYANKAMLYGQFVKGSTLSNGLETMETTVDDSSDEEPGEATQCLMPDQEDAVFKMCGGRTAHKGARHGLKLNGKLLRIQEQEKNLQDRNISELPNQNNPSISHSNSDGLKESERTVIDTSEEYSVKRSKKSKKKKRKQREDEDLDDLSHVGKDGEIESIELEDKEVLDNSVETKKRKKSKKRKKDTECDQVAGNDRVEADDDGIPSSDLVETNDIEAADNYLLTENTEVSKKRKKKKKKNRD